MTHYVLHSFCPHASSNRYLESARLLASLPPGYGQLPRETAHTTRLPCITFVVDRNNVLLAHRCFEPTPPDHRKSAGGRPSIRQCTEPLSLGGNSRDRVRPEAAARRSRNATAKLPPKRRESHPSTILFPGCRLATVAARIGGCDRAPTHHNFASAPSATMQSPSNSYAPTSHCDPKGRGARVFRRLRRILGFQITALASLAGCWSRSAAPEAAAATRCRCSGAEHRTVLRRRAYDDVDAWQLGSRWWLYPTCAAQDQRGVPRPQGANCDAGALEVVSIASSPTT